MLTNTTLLQIYLTTVIRLFNHSDSSLTIMPTKKLPPYLTALYIIINTDTLWFIALWAGNLPLSHREPSRHLWPLNSHTTGRSLHKHGFRRLKDLAYWGYIWNGFVLRACVVKRWIPQQSSCLSGFKRETDGLEIKTFAERWFCFV